jgi:hypothetical protein
MPPVCTEDTHQIEYTSEFVIDLQSCTKGEWVSDSVMECTADNIGTTVEWVTPLQCTEDGWQEAELECTADNEGATRIIPTVGHEVCRGGEWELETMPKEFQSRELR